MSATTQSPRPAAAGVLRMVIADDHHVDRDGIVRALMETGRYEIVGEAGDGVRVPVVVLLAFTEPRIVEQALKAGAAGYRSKDVPREEILVAPAGATLGGRIAQPSAGRDDGTLDASQPLTERERWLLRLAHAGILDTSDLAHHTGLSAAQVRGALSSAIDKLGAETLTEALGVTQEPASTALDADTAHHRPLETPIKIDTTADDTLTRARARRSTWCPVARR